MEESAVSADLPSNSSELGDRAGTSSSDRTVSLSNDVNVDDQPIILKECFKNVYNYGKHGNIAGICKQCGKELKGSLKSTTNFLNHLKTKGHGSLLEHYENVKANIIPDQAKRKKKKEGEESTSSKRLKQSRLTFNQAEKKDFDNAVVDFVTDTMSPLSIVDSDGFKNMIDCVGKLKEVPRVMGRKALTRLIGRKFEDQLKKTKDLLRTKDFVCTTADIWSTSKRSYLGMTAHWIEEDFQRKGVALTCKRLKGEHNFYNIAENISQVHSDYGLTLGKITKTITDNGSNMVKAFKEFGVEHECNVIIPSASCIDENDESNDESDAESEGEGDEDVTFIEMPNPDQEENFFELPPHERCSTHTLHLVALDIKKVLAKYPAFKKMYHSAMSKCQALFNLLSRSPKASEKCVEVLGKNLSSPVVTRWNSYFDSITSLIMSKEKINELMKVLKLPMIKESDFDFLEEYLQCTKPIAQSIDRLQGEENVYYGNLMPEIFRINKVLTGLELDCLKFCTPLVTVLKESIKDRFKKFFDFDFEAKSAILASTCHPFFKLRWVPKEKRDNVQAMFLTEVRRHRSQIGGIQQENLSSPHQLDEYYNFESDDSSPSERSGCSSVSNLEGLEYLKDTSHEVHSLNKYPTVKNIFMKYNTCLPSSAPVERLFSYGGMIMRPHRRKMSDKVFEKLLLLKANGKL